MAQLSKYKDLGAAKTGTGHYMMQKATSIGLILLSLVLAFGFSEMAANDFSYESLLAFIAVPTNAVLLVLFITAACYHFAGHVREVVEDYIHHEGVKIGLLLAVKFGAIFIAVSTIYNIILMSFSGLNVTGVS